MKYVKLFEGIDIDPERLLVSFNPNHQRNVNTGDLYEPKPIYDKINGWDVVSIFERKYNKERPNDKDGNPLVYALKQIYGWEFENPQRDIPALFRRFVAIAHKIDKSYDTIITVPSTSSLNDKFTDNMERIIRTKHRLLGLYEKMSKDDVWMTCIDFDLAEADGISRDKLIKILRLCFDKMPRRMFTYKTIPVRFRKYITQSFEFDDFAIGDADMINDKNVLILDDTIATGKTVSEIAKFTVDTFSPKKVTIITLFSALHK